MGDVGWWEEYEEPPKPPPPSAVQLIDYLYLLSATCSNRLCNNNEIILFPPSTFQTVVHTDDKDHISALKFKANPVAKESLGSPAFMCMHTTTLLSVHNTSTHRAIVNCLMLRDLVDWGGRPSDEHAIPKQNQLLN